MFPDAGAAARWVRASRRPAAIAALTAAGLALLLRLAGFEVGTSLTALWRGALGSPEAFFSVTCVRATPLLLAGLAVAIAFQAGIVNIGADGQLLAGATAAAAVGGWVGSSSGVTTPPAELTAGILAGAAWAGIAAVLRRRYRVPEVISTLMLNFLAVFGVSYLVRGPMQEPLGIYPQSEPLAAAARLPLLPGATRLHMGFLLAIGCAVGAWWVLRTTAAGFRARAVGANPTAARIAGRIDVDRVTLRVFLISGALAGLAGAIELTGVTFALYENLSPGYGYTAIAVALLARLRPLAVILTALLLGGLEAGGANMQRDAGVPAATVTAIEAALLLAVVGLDYRRRHVGGAPASGVAATEAPPG